MSTSIRVSLTKYFFCSGYYGIEHSALTDIVGDEGRISETEWQLFCSAVDHFLRPINKIRRVMKLFLLLFIILLVMSVFTYKSKVNYLWFLLSGIACLVLAVILGISCAPRVTKEAFQKIQFLCDEQTSKMMEEVLECSHVVFQLDDDLSTVGENTGNEYMFDGFYTYHNMHIKILHAPKMKYHSEFGLPVSLDNKGVDDYSVPCTRRSLHFRTNRFEYERDLERYLGKDTDSTGSETEEDDRSLYSRNSKDSEESLDNILEEINLIEMSEMLRRESIANIYNDGSNEKKNKVEKKKKKKTRVKKNETSTRGSSSPKGDTTELDGTPTESKTGKSSRSKSPKKEKSKRSAEKGKSSRSLSPKKKDEKKNEQKPKRRSRSMGSLTALDVV